MNWQPQQGEPGQCPQVQAPRLAAGLQALLVAGLLLLCAPAQATDAEARRQRLLSGYQQMHEAAAAADVPTCRAVLQAAEADLLQDWSTAALNFWRDRHACEAAGPWREKSPAPDEVNALFDDAVRHFDNPPSSAKEVVAGAAGELRAVHWAALRTHGHTALARSLEEAQLQDWLDAAAPPRSQPQADAALLRHARMLYGARLSSGSLQRWQQQFAERLGPGHLAVLALLRAQVFNHRQDSRPAEALAASDALAVLIARHHPANERLAMANRSERVGAFTALGRYADALDEGQQLLAWLGRQQPKPHANLMRSAYNLASLAITVADFDAAVGYAQLAIDEGAQADWGGARETHFARVLRELARLLRGDADGIDALQQALQALKATDLAITEALFELARSAGRHGRTDTLRWARERLVRLLAEHTIPLQPARALPLYLDVLAAERGSASAVQAGALPVAYGLLGRDPMLAVLSHFAWARHLAPQQPAGAIWLYKRGATALQGLRQGLPDTEQGVQRAWLSAYEDDLRQFIGLLIDAGRLTEADAALQVLRDEELADYQRRSRGAVAQRVAGQVSAGLSFTPDEARRNAAVAPAAAQLQAEAQAVDVRSHAAPTWADRVRAADAQADAALQAAAEALRGQALLAVPTITRAPRSAATQQTAALPPTEARLTYVFRPQGLEVLLQRGRRVQRVVLGGSAAEWNRAVHHLRSALAQPSAGADLSAVEAAAQTLHRRLLAPLLPQLAGVRHLRIAPDGALRFLPFAALHDGQRWLVQRFSLSIDATGSQASRSAVPAVALPPQRKHRPHLSALGRSLPDTVHAALPGVQAELSMLAALRGADVQHALDQAFTADALARAVARRPDVLHLASHVVLDVAGEEASYLLLGDGQRLSLRALRELPWDGVRLVLLSACDSATALSTSNAPGTDGAANRAWAGFAGALHAAGVPHVMATLWRIDDAQTADLMRLFYAPWQTPQQAKKQPRHGAPALNARHLADAQRAWLRHHRGGPWAHPHYWAAFQWLGRPQ